MCRFINKPFSFWKKEKGFRKRKTSYGEGKKEEGTFPIGSNGGILDGKATEIYFLRTEGY